MNYQTVVGWDASLKDLWFTDTDTIGATFAGLVFSGVKVTTGAPTATAGKFIPGARIMNAVDGTSYQNTGSTASPVWTIMDVSGAGFSLPTSETDSTTTTGTSFALIMSALTTGIAQVITAAALTTGKIYRAVAAAATMTTGRYFEANDGAIDVWGIGANGHIHTAQTTAPTITPTTPNGITAAAITAGGTDVCGIITTTGTQDGSGDTVLTVTFNKTYTAAPKHVELMPLNAAASKATATTLLRPYISAITATTFEITIPEDASAIATPSFSYFVIA